MSLSNYAENLVLNWLLTSASATRPSSFYVALSTADPTEDGSAIAEPADTYARQSATFTVTGNQAVNASNIEFPEATASWGTITHYALFDAASGGNMLMHGALNTSKLITAGDVARFIPSSITFTLD